MNEEEGRQLATKTKMTMEAVTEDDAGLRSRLVKTRDLRWSPLMVGRRRGRSEEEADMVGAVGGAGGGCQ